MFHNFGDYGNVNCFYYSQNLWLSTVDFFKRTNLNKTNLDAKIQMKYFKSLITMATLIDFFIP